MRAASLLLLLVGGCSTTTKSVVMEKGVASEPRRHDLFEATLEMLDRNPTYVDEFFEIARKHHATLERFTVNLTRALADPKLARLTALYLRDQPAALQEVMEQVLEHSDNRPGAQRALAEAMRAAFKDPAQRTTLKEAMKKSLSGD